MTELTRREYLLALAGAAVAAQSVRAAADEARPTSLGGALMILHTPFTSEGAVDWDDLAREAAFVDSCGGHGIVWPQGSSSVATLTQEERMRGMEVLAKAVRGRHVKLVLGVQGRNTAEMLAYVRAAEALAPDALIAMPPTSAATIDDYRPYFRALGQATSRPVVIQTSGGAPKLVPSTELIVDLAREFPHLGHVKEESEPLYARLAEEVRQRPPLKAVFSANLGVNWLYAMRIGVDGVITGNAMYADVMARIWELHQRRDEARLRDAFGRFLLMRNISDEIPGAELYIMKKRGIFKTTATRSRESQAGAQARVVERRLTTTEIDEIEYRFAALTPYLTNAGAP